MLRVHFKDLIDRCIFQCHDPGAFRKRFGASQSILSFHSRVFGLDRGYASDDSAPTAGSQEGFRIGFIVDVGVGENPGPAERPRLVEYGIHHPRPDATAAAIFHHMQTQTGQVCAVVAIGKRSGETGGWPAIRFTRVEGKAEQAVGQGGARFGQEHPANGEFAFARLAKDKIGGDSTGERPGRGTHLLAPSRAR